MAIQLQPDEFQRLVAILQNAGGFADPGNRRPLLQDALYGYPRAQALLDNLALPQPSRLAAVATLDALLKFGQVAGGKEALGVLLRYLEENSVGEQDAAYLRELLDRYPFDAPAVPPLAVKDWQGDETPALVQEKIVGENTLQHVRILELALEAARAVVHLLVPVDGRSAVGTGFMVAADLLMTNHHVIATPEAAAASEYTFNFQLDLEGKVCETRSAFRPSTGQFHTNPELDYTVVQVAGAPNFGQPLVLRPMTASKEDRVAIIQHPGGSYKQISLQSNFVAYADERVLQYTTSTLPGSSGSPVFNRDFEVIALHHSGGLLPQPDTGQVYERNAGSSMIAVLADLKANAPALYPRLNVRA